MGMFNENDDDYEEISPKGWYIRNLDLYKDGMKILILYGKSNGKYQVRERAKLRQRIADLLNKDDNRFTIRTLANAEKQRLEDISWRPMAKQK